MIRYRHSLLFAVVTLCGCQSFSGLFQNRFASTPEYSTEEMLAMSQPLPEATSPELGNGAMSANGQNGNPMALASYNSANPSGQSPGNSATGLVEAGQQAIRNAGQDNPAGLQQARQLFEQALTMDGNSADAHHGIAIVADLQEDWMTAEQHYKQALSRDPSNPSLLNDLGYSYLLQNRYHEAQQYLNQAIQISSKHERAHLNLALLSLRRGNSTAARQTLSQIYSQQDVQTNLARLQQDLQKLNSKTASSGMAASYPGGNSTVMVSSPQNSANAVYPVSQAQPADWNTQRPMGPGNAPQPGPNPAFNQNGFQNRMSGQGVPQPGGIQRYTDGATSIAIDPALRASDSDKPISLYPPGVVRDEILNGASQQQQQPYAAAQGMSQRGQMRSPMNPQFGNAQYGNESNPGGFPSQNSAGMQNQYPLVNSQPSTNQFGNVPEQGMMSSSGMPVGNPAMNGNPAMGANPVAFGLNVGPGMPFPVGNNAGQNSQPRQFAQQGQVNSQAEPLLNQYPAANPNLSNNGFGQANYGQAAGSQFPGGQPSGQYSANAVSYGQPQAQNQMPGIQGGMPMNSGAYGQPSYPNAQPQNFGQRANPSMGRTPGGMSHGMQQGMNPMPGQFNGAMPSGQNSPMQQFEQQQMNRINDQYQQAIQQMNSRGFSGQ